MNCLQKNSQFTSIYAKKIDKIVKKHILNTSLNINRSLCIIFLNKKNYILNESVKSIGKKINQRSYTKHAEVNATETFFKNYRKFSPSSSYVFSLRLFFKGDCFCYNNSKPCLDCYNHLLKKGFKNIFFNFEDGINLFYKIVFDPFKESVINMNLYLSRGERDYSKKLF